MLSTTQETAPSAVASSVVVDADSHADGQAVVCVTAVASGVQNSVMRVRQGQGQAEKSKVAHIQLAAI